MAVPDVVLACLCALVVGALLGFRVARMFRDAPPVVPAETAPEEPRPPLHESNVVELLPDAEGLARALYVAGLREGGIAPEYVDEFLADFEDDPKLVDGARAIARFGHEAWTRGTTDMREALVESSGMPVDVADQLATQAFRYLERR